MARFRLVINGLYQDLPRHPWPGPERTAGWPDDEAPGAWPNCCWMRNVIRRWTHA
jgi:hypothetical protein